jgi:REP element-mobilizing transposase RayT
MSSYTDICCHIVFATKYRERVLVKPRREDLYRFVWGVINKRKCHLYRINGVEDHVHILTSLHPTVPLASLVKEIKTASSAWIQGEKVFPYFKHWQEGYGAFSVTPRDRADLIQYIRNQEQHHQSQSFLEELREMVERSDMKWRSEYLP